MTTRPRLMSLLWLAALLMPLCTDAATRELAGTTPAGSAWRIAIPAGWAPGDGVVLVQHAYRFERVVEPSLGPLAEVMLADGYAVAAAGYRQSGWAVFDAVDDNHELLQLFRAQVGEPGAVLVHGDSMGALIALKIAEAPDMRERIDGVLALCPVVDGAGHWDEIFDLRVAYDAICAEVPGGQLPPGPPAMPWASPAHVLQQAPADPQALPAALRAQPGVQVCLGLHLPGEQRSTEARARLGRLQVVAGHASEEMLATQLAYALWGLADLVHDETKLNGRSPFSNRGMYPDGSERNLLYDMPRPHDTPAPDVDAHVFRTAADPAVRLDLARISAPEGSARTRILALHTSADGLVPARALQVLRKRMEHSEVAAAVVAESESSHCGFTQAEHDAAWRGFVAWVDSAPDSAAPGPASLLDACRLSATQEDCRFDVVSTDLAFAEDPLPFRRRDPFNDELVSRWDSGGLWTDPRRPAQGLLIEPLDEYDDFWREGEQRVAVSWYTWAPAGDPEPGPRWLYGVGRILEHAIYVDDMLEVRGGRFGASFELSAVTRERWGRIEILPVPGDAGGARLTYVGPDAWGAGVAYIGRLFASGYLWQNCDEICMDPHPPIPELTKSGTYFDMARPAGGWVLAQQGPYSTDIAVSFMVWFTWNAQGAPVWMYGLDADSRDGMKFALRQALSGGRFEPGYALDQVQFADWGTLDAIPGECEQRSLVEMQWLTTLPDFSSGAADVARLTWPKVSRFEQSCPSR